MLKDSGDYSHALDYTGGDIRRLRYLALSAASRIRDGAPEDVERMLCRYIAGVMINMKFSSSDRELRIRRKRGARPIKTAGSSRLVPPLLTSSRFSTAVSRHDK